MQISHHGAFIDGIEVEGGGKLVRRPDPANLDTVVSEFNLSTLEQVDAAVERAITAQRDWARTTGGFRATVLHRAADALGSEADSFAAEITAIEGKTIREATGEVLRARDTLRIAAEMARIGHDRAAGSDELGTRLITQRRPLGVAALITPWNFPIGITVRKAAPALAAGNAVVLKPSSMAAWPSVRLAALMTAAGLPTGLLGVVLGEAEVAKRLLENAAIAGISFTGSTEVGRQIASVGHARAVPVQAEMGGHSPVIVADDADLDVAADIAVRGAFFAAGQTCTATRRVIVNSGRAAGLREAIIARAAALTMGPGTDADTDVPPMISADRRDAFALQLARAEKDGVERIRLLPLEDHHARGAYHVPTLLAGVARGSWVSRTELFGPALSLISVADEHEALEVANDVGFGLSAAIVTTRRELVEEFLAVAESGMLHVNRPTVGSDPQMPFGGIKDSSIGAREQSWEGFAFFTTQQTVYLR